MGCRPCFACVSSTGVSCGALSPASGGITQIQGSHEGGSECLGMGAQVSWNNITCSIRPLEGIRRMLARPVQKKEPMTIEMLAELVADTDRHSTSTNIRLTTACLLAFAGFLQFDKLAHLRPADIEISSTMAKIHVQQSKTDQLRKGNEVLIARTGIATCPVAMLARYLSTANIPQSLSCFCSGQLLKPRGVRHCTLHGH